MPLTAAPIVTDLRELHAIEICKYFASLEAHAHVPWHACCREFRELYRAEWQRVQAARDARALREAIAADLPQLAAATPEERNQLVAEWIAAKAEAHRRRLESEEANGFLARAATVGPAPVTLSSLAAAVAGIDADLFLGWADLPLCTFAMRGIRWVLLREAADLLDARLPAGAVVSVLAYGRDAVTAVSALEAAMAARAADPP